MMDDSTYLVETFQFRGRTIEIKFGSIAEVVADAIVSSDDNHLTMSGGVSQAIRSAAGDVVWNESRQSVPAAIGSAVITRAGHLRAQYVLHAIVIDFDSHTWPDLNIIRDATKCCFNEADRLGCKTVALPALGTGAGGLSSEYAAQAMISVILEELKHATVVGKVTLVLHRRDALFDFFKTAIDLTIKAEYEEKLDVLQRDKDNLIVELEAQTRYRGLPFPIAVTRRMIETHNDFHSKLSATIECAESIVWYCTSIALADYLRVEPNGSKEVFTYFDKYVTFGSWLVKLDETLKRLKNRETFSIIPELHEFYFSKNKGRMDKIKDVRDKELGHGATLSDSSYRQLHEEMVHTVDAILSELSFLAEYPLIVVTQSDIFESEYEYQTVKLMGDNVIFPKNTLRCQHLRLTRDIPYILDAKREQALSVVPFLIFETCPSCRLQETFFLEHTNDKECSYHTHRANHRLQTAKYLEYFGKMLSARPRTPTVSPSG